MAENKTKPTGVKVEDFISAVPDAQRRDDARTLVTLMERLSGETAYMWGPSIIGFGSYRYPCGKREEEAPRLGFSPRAKELVVYLVPEHEGKDDLLAKLGKHRLGKACLYIKRLSDVDERMLEELITATLVHMDEKYPRER
jgi:hypothetical protein